MKSFYSLVGLLLVGGVLAAQPAPAPEAATADFTFTLEGTIAPGPAFKLVVPCDGHTVEASQRVMVNQTNDSDVQFAGTLTAVKNGYRLDYTLTLRAPGVTPLPGGPAVSPSASRAFTNNIITKASVILPLGQSVEVSGANGKTITMTLAKSSAK